LTDKGHETPYQDSPDTGKIRPTIGSTCGYTEDGGNCLRTSFIISYLHKTLTERPNKQKWDATVMWRSREDKKFIHILIRKSRRQVSGTYTHTDTWH